MHANWNSPFARSQSISVRLQRDFHRDSFHRRRLFGRKIPFADDPKAAKAGEYEFRINCALCHGLGARGGGRGPDLTRPRKNTRTPTRTCSRSSATASRHRNAREWHERTRRGNDRRRNLADHLLHPQPGSKGPAKSLGNAVHGKELFYGDANCSMCHMVNGRGGRLGPDLSEVGTSRTHAALVESVRDPSRRLAWGLTESTKEFPQEYETVTVVTGDGKEIKGVTLNEDSFTVQVMDSGERIHLLEKDKLKSFQKSRESMMPKYTTDTLSDKELEDVLAFLASVGAK